MITLKEIAYTSASPVNLHIKRGNVINCMNQGALGTGSTDDQYEAEELALPENTTGIAAGHYHSLAWTSTGQLFTWG